jgi:hypothetical protein
MENSGLLGYYTASRVGRCSVLMEHVAFILKGSRTLQFLKMKVVCSFEISGS